MLRVLAALMLLLGASGAFAESKPQKPQDSAEGVVTALYQAYTAPTGATAGFNYSDQKTASRLLDPALTRLFVVDGRRTTARLTLDPFVDGKPAKVENLQIETRTVSPKEAQVTARFTALGQAKAIVYKVILTPAGWRITDLGPVGSSETVRTILNRLPE